MKKNNSLALHGILIAATLVLPACDKRATLDFSDPQVKQRIEAKRDRTDMELLAKITLPQKPTKQQVRAYINAILYVSRSQQIHLASDPQVLMLVQIGHENLDELLTITSAYESTMAYTVAAISALAIEEDKEKIIKALDRHPPLVEVVMAKGWVQDARVVLIRRLKENPSYLPYQWIAAVASLQDPSTYDALAMFLANGSNRRITYKCIASLPGIDLTKAAPIAWEKSKGDRYEVAELTEAALSVGYLPALDFVVETLENNNNLPPQQYSPRALMFQFTGIQGNNVEMKTWYDANRKKLIFDSNTKRFIAH